MIKDLEAKIEEVKLRASAKELKQSPAMKRTLSIVRALDKGMTEAKEEGNSQLRHALADARRSIGDYAEAKGVRLPKPRMPRGRRPKA